jgi:hypothetical protein
MTGVVLYARYSSDNQSVASIEDQFRICREHAAREKWKVVGTSRCVEIHAGRQKCRGRAWSLPRSCEL